MAELHTMRQSDTDSLKAFLTRQSDQARFAYGRLPGTYPRQGIFIATYNPGPDGTYLKDDTGNRRWWPVKCGGHNEESRRFDFEGLSSVRNQLFAEALARYRMGEALTMDTEELQDAATSEQKERHAEHPWTERICEWLHERDKMPDTRKDFYTAREVWIFGMNGLDARFDRREQIAIARVMRELGWKPGVSRLGEDMRVTRGYMRSRIAKALPTVKTKKEESIFGDML
jgi:predicted P-loop ATPase